MSDAIQYYPINKAAETIGCDASDIIHMAAAEKIGLFTAISPFKQVDIFGYSPDGELLHEERNTKWFGGFAGLSPLHAKAYEAGDNTTPTYFAIPPEGREKIRRLSTIPHLLASPSPRLSNIPLFVLASDVQALKASWSAMKENRTLFHKDLCDRQFGSAVLHVKSLQKWTEGKGLILRTVPALDDYELVQAECLLCAIETGAMPKDEETAEAIVAANPTWANNRAAEIVPRWHVAADAHSQWRALLTKAIEDGELQLLDFGSLLPIGVKIERDAETKENDSPREDSETPKQRQQRIFEYVNKAAASGKTKKSAYEELAEIEQCGVNNIVRMYKSAKSRHT